MEDSQHSSITFAEFEGSIGTIWRELQQEKDFCDMTLACNGRQIYAHKAIISACSPVLRNILKQNLEKSPLIYLGDVRKANLNNLLNFMYQGEANVFEKDLGSFCKLAQDLKIEGFFKESNSKEKSDMKSVDFNNESNPSPKRKIVGKENTEGVMGKQSDTIDVNCDQVNNDSMFDNKIKEESSDNNYDQDNGDHMLLQEEKQEQEFIPTKSQQIKTKKEITAETIVKNASNEGFVDSEIIKPNTLGIFCPHCNKTFTHRSSRAVHIRTVHEGFRLSCTLCDHYASTKSNLKRHVEGIHSDIEGLVIDYSSKNINVNGSLVKNDEVYPETSDMICDQDNSEQKQDKEIELKEVVNKKEDSMEEKKEQEILLTKDQQIRMKNEITPEKFVKNADSEMIKPNTKGIFCPHCNKTFTHSSSRSVHIRTLHEGFRLPCTFCDHYASTKSNLKAHIERNHSEVDGSVNNCSSKTTDIKNSNILDVISPEVKHKTSVINFDQDDIDIDIVKEKQKELEASTKNEHRKNYSCDQCEKSFIKKGHLVTHFRYAHEGLRFPCSNCDYLSTTPSNLQKHIQRKHTEQAHI